MAKAKTIATPEQLRREITWTLSQIGDVDDLMHLYSTALECAARQNKEG